MAAVHQNDKKIFFSRALSTFAAMLTLVSAVLLGARPASAIDFYEIQIYETETTPQGHFELELHSNSVTTATGTLAKEQLNPYQVHETLEGTYGLLPWLEVGQYFATAKFNEGQYGYAGSRTKMHFGIPQTFDWPVKFGGNIELDYMRFQAEENPMTLEVRPIVESDYKKFTVVANLAFEDPFSGPGAHQGWQFEPSGEIEYDLTKWISPALEYYGDMGAMEKLPAIQKQQHFIVPAANLNLDPRLELNLGVGIGTTDASHGVFVKSIVGWEF